MIDDPFRPPEQVGQHPGYAASPEQPDYSGYSGFSSYPNYPSYPPPTRRGWPSWLIVLVGAVSGLALAGASTAAIVGIATTPDPPSSSSSASAPSAGGNPSPGDGSGDRSLQIEFPNGATGTFAVPTGLHHEPDDDDDGHVALAADDDDNVYLDLYTDDTTASNAHDLHRMAQEAATDDRNHSNVVSAITFRTVGGRSAAQYTLTHQGDNGDATFESLVTVVLVGDEELSLYWTDDPDDFLPDGGQKDAAAVLASLHVSGGSNDDSGSGSSA